MVGVRIDGEGEMTTELVALYSAILIFNCAVCLQRNGSEKAMCKASTLYMQSWQLLEPMFSSPCSLQVFGFDCSDLLAGILGNQANIFYQCYDFHSVRCIMDQLFLLTHREQLSESKIIAAPVA